MASATNEKRAAQAQLTPDIERQATAAKALREALAAFGDDDLVLDTIEGETTLFDDIDKLLSAIDETRALIIGSNAVIDDLQARRERFQERLNALRSVIEHALSIAEITSKIERPGATVFLSHRAPKLDLHTEADVPADYWKPGAPVLDRSKLIDALRDGPVPGAALVPSAPSLTLRYK